jgi:hypothetical protein
MLCTWCNLSHKTRSLCSKKWQEQHSFSILVTQMREMMITHTYKTQPIHVSKFNQAPAHGTTKWSSSWTKYAFPNLQNETKTNSDLVGTSELFYYNNSSNY